MATDQVRHAVWVNCGGRCQCTRTNCRHPRVTGGTRCTRTFTEHGDCQVHRKVAGGAYVASNCEALCTPCHEQTRSYGRGRS